MELNKIRDSYELGSHWVFGNGGSRGVALGDSAGSILGVAAAIGVRLAQA